MPEKNQTDNDSPEKDQTVNDTPERDQAVNDTPEQDDEKQTYIAHERTWTDNDGIVQRKTERMKTEDWLAYAEKHNL